jgi:hypothetical protein
MSIQPVPLRGLLRPTSILALFCWLLTFPGVLRAAEPSASRDLVPVCWSPTELAKDTEQKTWYHAPDAFAASPEDAPPNLRGVIRAVRVTSARKPVALTFDLCEGPYEVAGFDGRIPDYLRANNIHATFFVGGKWIKTHQARAKQLMSDPLFELGNHTWAHSNLRTLSRLAITDEVKKAQIAYEQTRAELTTKQCVARDRSWLASRSFLDGRK